MLSIKSVAKIAMHPMLGEPATEHKNKRQHRNNKKLDSNKQSGRLGIQ